MAVMATFPFISHLRSHPPPPSCVSPSFSVTFHISDLPYSLRQQSLLTRCSCPGRMGSVNKEKMTRMQPPKENKLLITHTNVQTRILLRQFNHNDHKNQHYLCVSFTAQICINSDIFYCHLGNILSTKTLPGGAL